MISNDDDIYKHYHLKKTGEVDSQVIPLLINRYMKKHDTVTAIKKAVSRIIGSQACAMIDKKTPDTLYLWTTTNPLNLAYNTKTGTILFASTEDILQNSLTTWTLHNMIFWQSQPIDPQWLFYEVPDNTGLVIKNGVPEIFTVKAKERPFITTSYNRTPTPPVYVDRYCAKCTGYHKKNEPCIRPLTPDDSIKKPSLYTVEELTARLQILDSKELTNGLTVDEKSEANRIENALDDRRMNGYLEDYAN